MGNFTILRIVLLASFLGAVVGCTDSNGGPQKSAPLVKKSGCTWFRLRGGVADDTIFDDDCDADYDEEEEEEEGGWEDYACCGEDDHDRRSAGQSRCYSQRQNRKKSGQSREILRERLQMARADLETRVVGAKHKATKIMREARTTVSSDLESVLLKATRPDNQPAKRKYVDVVVDSASKHFPRFMKSAPGAPSTPVGYNNNPYEQLLTKLWKKMMERDWRTVAKALYILHCLGVRVSDKSWHFLAHTFVSLRSSKQSQRMFTRKGVLNLSESGSDYSLMLDVYSQHVWTRVACFSPSLKELDAADDVALEKAQKVIRTAISCRPLLQDGLDSDITCDLLHMVLLDLVSVWDKYQQQVLEKVKRMNEMSQKELRHTMRICEFCLGNSSDASALIRDAHRLLAHYGISSPRNIEGMPSSDILAERLVEIKQKLREAKR